ncbi:hypothetical protein D0B32_20340 [Paraburkholderia sp. DHOC27]|nr:hypothetical protein D0B32_20340 [Paraburkholderia sp. DHOC27]
MGFRAGLAAAFTTIDRTLDAVPPTSQSLQAERGRAVETAPFLGDLSPGLDFLGSECALRTLVCAPRHDAQGHHHEYRDDFEDRKDDEEVHGVHEKSHGGVQGLLDVVSLTYRAAGPISEESPIHDSIR